MKICWTIFRDMEKQSGKMVRDDLIKDLLDMGVPEALANELLHKDSFKWQGNAEGCDTLIALDILPDKVIRKRGRAK